MYLALLFEGSLLNGSVFDIQKVGLLGAGEDEITLLEKSNNPACAGRHAQEWDEMGLGPGQVMQIYRQVGTDIGGRHGVEVGFVCWLIRQYGLRSQVPVNNQEKVGLLCLHLYFNVDIDVNAIGQVLIYDNRRQKDKGKKS